MGVKSKVMVSTDIVTYNDCLITIKCNEDVGGTDAFVIEGKSFDEEKKQYVVDGTVYFDDNHIDAIIRALEILRDNAAHYRKQ